MPKLGRTEHLSNQSLSGWLNKAAFFAFSCGFPEGKYPIVNSSPLQKTSTSASGISGVRNGNNSCGGTQEKGGTKQPMFYTEETALQKKWKPVQWGHRMEVTSINEGHATTLCHNGKEMRGLCICTLQFMRPNGRATLLLDPIRPFFCLNQSK